MILKNKDNILRVGIHILAGTMFLLFPMIFWHGPFQEDKNILTNPFIRRDFLGYVFTLGFFYFNFYVLIPRLFFAKKHFLFGMSIVLCFILIIVLPNILTPDFYPDLLGKGSVVPDGIKDGHFNRNPFFFHIEHNFTKFFIVFILSLLVKINVQWKRAQKEKMSAELSYLRAQINPHFLFNTLNSIYSMALSKSDNTPTAVVKLSAMMRYAITEAHRDFVPLEKEIDYIADFIALQEFRLGHTVKLSHRVSGDPVGKKIAPLILISIVENAFKYGVNPEENSSIMVDLTVHEFFLVFLVRNNKVRTNVDANEKSGIGIENTRSRLNLLYPGKHKFEITENPVDYSVLLTLQLT